MMSAAMMTKPKYPVIGYTVPTNLIKPTKLARKARIPTIITDNLNRFVSAGTSLAVNAYSIPTAVL
ncbi:hypothetical protein SRABI80_04725 [Peribacillus frigoritolerans]|nr:hypothetical protein SRABI80_04725 [Peribacillus frigoritolerans]